MKILKRTSNVTILVVASHEDEVVDDISKREECEGVFEMVKKHIEYRLKGKISSVKLIAHFEGGVFWLHNRESSVNIMKEGEKNGLTSTQVDLQNAIHAILTNEEIIGAVEGSNAEGNVPRLYGVFHDKIKTLSEKENCYPLSKSFD